MKDFFQLSTVEILNLITGDFSTNSYTDDALIVYLFAKKVANAASIAMQLTAEFATEQLIEAGGKGENSFSKFHIDRQFQKEFAKDERRDSLLVEIEGQSALLNALKDRLKEVEKEMEKDGLVKKDIVGHSIKVSLLDKI